MLRRVGVRCGPKPTCMAKGDIDEALAHLPGWSADLNRTPPAILKKYRFADFSEAWAFMSACVPYIESVDHHPEWFNVYNRVDVTLTTHDCSGISAKDIALAKHMEEQAHTRRLAPQQH